MTTDNNKAPLSVRLFIYISFAAGVYSLIIGLQFLYSNIVFNARNGLCVVFLLLGLLFLVAGRGLMKYEKWAHTFTVVILLLLFLAAVYSFKSSRIVPFMAQALFAIISIVILKQHRIVKLFNHPTPAALRKTANYLVLSIVGISMLLPFLWMLSTSLKEAGEVLDKNWLPTRKFTRIENHEYEVSLKTAQAEVIYQAGPNKNKQETINAKRLKTVLTDRWLCPLEFIKWSYFLRENNSAIVPVEVVQRYSLVKLLTNGPRKSEIIRIKQSGLLHRFRPRYKNYSEAFSTIMIGTLYRNSIIIAVIITLGQVFTSSLAGYAFSRLHFPFRDKLFLAYLATMMVPAAVTMIPLFILFKKANLVDTHLAVILPGIFSAYGTFMLRQFFMSVPRELEESAKIDGCNLFGIYWRVILPLSKPALATLATFTFMGSWRAFIWPLIVLNTPEKMTLPIGLNNFMTQYGVQWNLLMAGTIMAIMPILLIFLFNQRFFIKGIQLGAVKG